MVWTVEWKNICGERRGKRGESVQEQVPFGGKVKHVIAMEGRMGGGVGSVMDGVVVDGVVWGWRDHHQQQAMEGIHYSTLPLQLLRGAKSCNHLQGNWVALSQDGRCAEAEFTEADAVGGQPLSPLQPLKKASQTPQKKSRLRSPFSVPARSSRPPTISPT